MRMLKKISKQPKRETDRLKSRLNLSEEEEMVFDSIMKKKSVTEIAMDLNISERTVFRRIDSIESSIDFLNYLDMFERFRYDLARS